MRATLLCFALALPAPASFAAADDWPQWRGEQRDGVWREEGLIERFPDSGPEVLWRVPVGAGYSGPTVVGARVFLTDRVTEADEAGDEVELERVVCFDRASGEVLWEHAYPCDYAGLSYPDGPRCAVLVQDGRAYSLGSMGNLLCLNVEDGALLWEHDLAQEYGTELPVWGIAASPLIEDDLLIVPACGKEGTYLVAFDRESGEEAWTALSDRGNYSSPIMIDQAGERVLVCWTGDRVVGVAPADGELLWEHDFPAKNMPLGVASPVLHEDMLFFTGFYDGSLLLRLKQDELGVEELWRRRGQNEIRTDALQSIISTPFIKGDHIYGVDSHGELRCLQVEDGERVWEDLTAVPKARWSTIHFVQQGERTWMFTERGDLVIARLDPEGYHELSRAHLLDPTLGQLNRREGVCWSHPAFAAGCVFARNDEELVCVDLSKR